MNFLNARLVLTQFAMVSSLCLLGSSFGYAKPATPAKALPPLLQEVEKKYAESQTLEADFSQSSKDAVLSQNKLSSGKIFVKRPSKIRWETQKPDENLLVSDGKTYWFYTPPFDEGERGQVIEKKSNEVQSKLAHALLAGSFSVARDMTIRPKNSSTFLLIPRPGTAGTVTQATIEVDPEKKLIQKVILDHKGGNHSEISLTNISLGKTLKEDIFTFKAPPNTDKVDVK
jgi:outer membrane lipoprotein carrier protein